jgi:hypothetical protein
VRSRIRAAQSGETSRALAFDQGAEGLPQKCALLSRPGQALRLIDQIVIQCNRGSHRHLRIKIGIE